MPSSTQPSHGLTIWDASSSAYTLGVMLLAVVILLPVILAYTAWVFHVLRGRITLEDIRRHTGFYLPGARGKRAMWYFSWILGTGFALAFGVLNAMWYEITDRPEQGESDNRRQG